MPDPVEIADALRGLQHRLRHRAHAETGDLGVTPAQARLLRVLGRCERAPRMGELAERLRVAPRSVTDLVDPLEERGLLRREQDPANRRVALVRLTDEGRRVHAELHERARASAATAFEVLDEAERAQLLALLRRVTTALDTAGDPAP
ncbi:MarR family winged helix-turn-helix transcriptional regulator [Kineococcus terrestris]|uniref:MarR family winged helix-turn-helix transcriptional regulator n=1 Tax=Kineococcus terrestris TaxID=2044856 RepID=UPI0034DB7533